MKRTLYDVLEELQTDFRDLNIYLRDLNIYLNRNNNLYKGEQKKIVRSLINEYMIPKLEELSELLED